MVTQKKEFRVWVWDKVLKRYLILPGTMSTYDKAVFYLEKQEQEMACYQPNLDYSKFQIKVRTVTFTDWEVLYG